MSQRGGPKPSGVDASVRGRRSSVKRQAAKATELSSPPSRVRRKQAAPPKIPTETPPEAAGAPPETAKHAAGLWIRLAKCHDLVLQQIRRQMAQTETTLPQFDVLAQLLRHPEGMTSGALSKVLLVTAGNLTGIVDRLEARGLITRRALNHDKRVRVIRLTAAGLAIAKHEVARHEQWLLQIFGALESSEQAKLIKSLDQLRRQLSAAHLPSTADTTTS